MVEEDIMVKKIIGFLAPDLSTSKELDKYKLDGIEGRKHLTIKRSSIEFHPPYTLENDVDLIFASANRVIDELESSIPDLERSQYASAAWHSSAGMGMATKVFAHEISQHLDKVPPIALNRPTAAALELRDGAQLAIRFERDLQVSAITPDGSVRDLGLTTYGDSPLISPGTVVAAKISRPIDPKLRIHTEIGEFVVNPAPAIGRIQIEDFTGKFAFDRRDKDIAVDYLGSGGRRIPIGVLGRELINKESKANLKSGSNLLKGTLSRGLSENILEIQVLDLIDHQPVARIDRGELIALQQQSIPLERHDPAVSSDRCYYPTAGDLRQLYSAAELAGDIAKMAQVKNLGTLLNEVYPDGVRAPDDFSHRVVEMQRPEVPVTVEIPTSKDLYYPSAGELRTAYTVKSLSGKTADLNRIIELGNALNRAYPDGNRAPDDFTSLGVGISIIEKQSLEIDMPQLKSSESAKLEDLTPDSLTSQREGNGSTLSSLIEKLRELNSNSTQGATLDIDLTIRNILSPFSKNEPKVVSLISEMQAFSQSEKTHQMGLEEFVSRLEANLMSEEPAVTVSISRSKNPKLAEIMQDTELDISL
jgi:hypothetical protein